MTSFDGNQVRWGSGGPFGVVPAWVMDAEVSDRAVRLYVLLARFAGSPEASTFRGKIELAERLNCAKSSVEKATSELVRIGALSTVARHDGKARLANSYVVHAAPAPLLRAEGGSPAPSGGGSPAPSGGSLARLIGGKTPKREEAETSVSSSGGLPAREGDQPPRLELVDGRNLGFDALAEVCGYDPDRTQDAAEVAVALNGSRKTGPGIRAELWTEDAAAGWRPAEMAEANPEGWERRVAAVVLERAALYRRKMPGATLTPTALAKWWGRLPAMPDGDRRVTADRLLGGPL